MTSTSTMAPATCEGDDEKTVQVHQRCDNNHNNNLQNGNIEEDHHNNSHNQSSNYMTPATCEGDDEKPGLQIHQRCDVVAGDGGYSRHGYSGGKIVALSDSEQVEGLEGVADGSDGFSSSSKHDALGLSSTNKQQTAQRMDQQTYQEGEQQIQQKTEQQTVQRIEQQACQEEEQHIKQTEKHDQQFNETTLCQDMRVKHWETFNQNNILSKHSRSISLYERSRQKVSANCDLLEDSGAPHMRRRCETLPRRLSTSKSLDVSKDDNNDDNNDNDNNNNNNDDDDDENNNHNDNNKKNNNHNNNGNIQNNTSNNINNKNNNNSTNQHNNRNNNSSNSHQNSNNDHHSHNNNHKNEITMTRDNTCKDINNRDDNSNVNDVYRGQNNPQLCQDMANM